MSAQSYTPPWAAQVQSRLADRGAVPLDHLAAAAGVAGGLVRGFLESQPGLLETGVGWVDAASVADGIAFTHELSEVECDRDLLAADDDLALVAFAASGGLPLATGGGEVAATAASDLPPARVAGNSHLAAARGLVGQALVGPPGWLADFRPGDLLQVRLHGGQLEVAIGGVVASPPATDSPWAAAIRTACASAAERALDAYAGPDEPEVAVGDLAVIIAELILTHPELHGEPLPPLRSVLASEYEAFGGYVGVPGVPWVGWQARRLSRAETVAGIRTVRALLNWDHDDPGPAAVVLDRLLSSPPAIRYVADEVERRTALDGVTWDGALDWLATAARTPAGRAVVALLRARAAEGAGDSATAERLVHQALADQPGLGPARMDAGEYAACRGDLPAAIRYLRGADGPAEDLATPVRSVLDAPAATGRNQPCPCGSGRKYKVCCRNGAQPLTVRAPLVYALLGAFAQRSPFGDRLTSLLTRVEDQISSGMLCLDLVIQEDGFTERFLRARAGWLRADERRLVETWRDTPITLYEVRGVRPGTGVVMRTLPGGTPFFQRDRKLSTTAQRLWILCGRMLTDGSELRLISPMGVLPRDVRREALELFAAGPTADEIANLAGPPPAPHLVNSDEHELVFSELTLEVPDPAAAWQRLATRMVQTDHHVLEWHVETDGGPATSRGSVTWDGPCWQLWANSRERLEALVEYVRPAAPDAREVSRRYEPRGGPRHSRGRTARTLMIHSELVPDAPGLTPERAQEKMLRERQESWLDTPVVDGLSPREAVKAGGDARAELEAILDDMQWHNDRNREAGRPTTMDVAGIRADLGIPETASI